MLLEMIEDGNKEQGKTKEWLRERVKKGMFLARCDDDYELGSICRNFKRY